MKKFLSFMLFLSTFLYPVFAQYQGELMGGSEDEEATCVHVFSYYMISAGYYQSEDGDFSSNYGNEDCFVSADCSWKTVFGGSGHDYIYDIGSMNGSIYAVGSSDSNDFDITGNHGGQDFLVAKLNSTGQLLWTKSFGGSGTDIATSVTFIDNNIWVLGYSNSTDGDITGNKGDFDLWLLKLDTDGNLLWQKNYGGSNDDRSSDIDLDLSLPANLLIAGYSKSSDGDLTFNHGDYDYWLLCVNTNGDIIWQQSLGGSGTDIKPSISTKSGNVDIVGSSNSTDGDITNPLGGYDVWWLTGFIGANGFYPNYSYNMGGSNDDFGTDVLNFPYPICGSPMVFITFYSDSSDGNTNVNHGGYDAWLVHTDYYNFEFFNYGGQNDDKFLSLPSYLFEFNGDVMLYNYCVGSSLSDDIPGTNPHGKKDAWFVYGQAGGINEYTISVKVFPNPVSNQLHIQVEEGQIKNLWLYDMTGKLLLHKNLKSLSDTYTLKLPQLKTGNYWLKITTAKGMAIKKITKI